MIENPAEGEEHHVPAFPAFETDEEGKEHALPPPKEIPNPRW
jgi:hypothetical protein